jgi:hypothetical protein
MRQPQQRSLKALLPQIDADCENPFADGVRHPTSPVVLETVDTGQELRDRSVSILCPGCSGVVTRYSDGLPARIARFEKDCEDCETLLKRWSVLAVDTAYERAPDPAELRQSVTHYWEQNLWSGIVTGETSPRTREYSELYSAQADAFNWTWEVTCPLCRREHAAIEGSLDYHHWTRDPDQGVCLCRPCHDALSGQQRDTDLDWAAQQLGLRNKHDLQITRLALRELAVTNCDSLPTLVKRLHSRYNLAQTRAQVIALLSQTLSDMEVLEQVNDEYLLAELSASSDESDLVL